MKAIILAAGYGTRLYPLTINTPKPLIEIAGISLIDRIISFVNNVSLIKDIYVVTNHRFIDNFDQWLERNKKKYTQHQNITLIDDKTTLDINKLGPIGDILFTCKSQAIQDDLLIIAGDNIFNINFSQMFKLFKEKKGSVLAVFDFEHIDRVRNRFGVVEIDDSAKLISFEEKPEHPKSTIGATALYLLKQTDVEIVKASYEECNKLEINAGEMIKILLKANKPVYCVNLSEWFDIGSFDYQRFSPHSS